MAKEDKTNNPLIEALMAQLRPQMAEALKTAQARLLKELTQGTVSSKASPAPTVSKPRRDVRSKSAPVKPERDWAREKKHCKRCDRTKPVDPDFGVTRDRNGEVRPQGWCRDCRAKENYHKNPRKYRTRKNS